MKIDKKTLIIIVLVFAVIIAILGRNHIRYFLSGGDDIFFSTPDAVFFKLENNSGDSDLYYIDSISCWHEGTTPTYHVFVDSKYLDNNDSYAYFSGCFWNYPYKPTIKINGKIVDNIEIGNSGKTDKDVYFSKKYHFYYYDTIQENQKYEIYVRCENISAVVNIIFHASN